VSDAVPISRRTALHSLAGAVVTAAGVNATTMPGERGADSLGGGIAGRIKQSACRWPYNKIPLEELCTAVKGMGLQSIDLVDEKEWPTLQRAGLICAMTNGPGPIGVGFNRPSEHDRLVAESERLLPKLAEFRYPNMIVFSGNRAGLSDGEGLDNCARGVARITPVAERLGVTVCMELLNSKVDHKDYQCDHTAWGVELVKRVSSPRFKLLYDIYHMQIMEGDVIRTIRQNAQHIAHYHTGGVPGRNEIDESQELNYAAVMRAIADTGFTGFVAQEFVPTRDPLTSLRQAVKICDV
jgi:hydroxypyruvate isomerase